MSTKWVLLVIVVVIAVLALPSAHAATCTNTAYNNFTCVQAFLNNSGSCLIAGSTQTGYATVTSGDRLLLWEGMGGPTNSITITGNLGTVWTPLTSYSVGTVSGTLNSGSTTVTISTSSFTAAMVKGSITIAGAGASGGLYTGMITSQSGTSAVIAPATGTTVSTGAAVSFVNQGTTQWGSSGENYSFGLFTAIPTSSGSLNLTFTCNQNNNMNTESVFMELRSSKGTVGIDGQSAWTPYLSSTGPFGQTTTPLAVSSYPNDLNISRLNSDSAEPPICSGWTEITEVTSDINLGVQAAGSAGTVNCIWGTTGSQNVIVGALALNDGSPPQASTPTFSPASGTYSTGQSVTISASTGPTICYNFTGSPQTNGSTGCTVGTLYSTAVAVSTSETLYAVAGGTGYADSAVGSAGYVISSSLSHILTGGAEISNGAKIQ